MIIAAKDIMGSSQYYGTVTIDPVLKEYQSGAKPTAQNTIPLWKYHGIYRGNPLTTHKPELLRTKTERRARLAGPQVRTVQEKVPLAHLKAHSDAGVGKMEYCYTPTLHSAGGMLEILWTIDCAILYWPNSPLETNASLVGQARVKHLYKYDNQKKPGDAQPLRLLTSHLVSVPNPKENAKWTVKGFEESLGPRYYVRRIGLSFALFTESNVSAGVSVSGAGVGGGVQWAHKTANDGAVNIIVELPYRSKGQPIYHTSHGGGVNTHTLPEAQRSGIIT
jgi:hypothetical protein